MSLLVAIIIGGIIGWLASILMKANSQMGILANVVVVGIIGSFLGTAVASALNMRVHSGLESWIVAVAGAALLITILRALGVFRRLAAVR